MIDEIKKRIERSIETLNQEVERINNDPGYTVLYKTTSKISKDCIINGMLLTMDIIEEVEAND